MAQYIAGHDPANAIEAVFEAVLANFRKVAGERPIKIHPMVARLIDPKVLERLRGAQQA